MRQKQQDDDISRTKRRQHHDTFSHFAGTAAGSEAMQRENQDAPASLPDTLQRCEPEDSWMALFFPSIHFNSSVNIALNSWTLVSHQP